MSRSLNFLQLRHFNGSQHAAFEALCCQLAAHEPAPPGAVFVPKGAPDAGVECYWKLPDGSERAWQAKFFLSKLEKSQWEQLDKSVKTALDKHPRLTEYIVCLPVDREDPRLTDTEGRPKKSFMTEWDAHVEKWRAWAGESGMSVAFTYWGEQHIYDLLSRDEHSGRRKYWFNDEFLSDVWLRRALDVAIADAGERYTPELNVELPVAQLFDGLGRTPDFFRHVKLALDKVRRAYSDISRAGEQEPATGECREACEATADIVRLFEARKPGDFRRLPFHEAAVLAEKAQKAANRYAVHLQSRADSAPRDRGDNPPYKTSESERLLAQRRYAYELANALYAFQALCTSAAAELANEGALLLLGEAGAGKTHLFCDVAEARLARHEPTILILGQHLEKGDPKPLIPRLLGLDCTLRDLLGALDAAGEARNAVSILMIDALNEGEARLSWAKHLGGLLEILRDYPHVAIALSVRSSYEDLVVSKALLESGRLIRGFHAGFSEHEYQATKRFFDAFGIVLPSVPILNPEFSNPLFLKLFCTGLRNKNLTEVPKGFTGVTAVFSFLIDSVNDKLSRPESLDFDARDRVVQRALDGIADRMAETEEQWLPREEAKAIANGALPTPGTHDGSLFAKLVSEGLLSEDRYFIAETQGRQDVIRFAYERLADHAIVRRLLDRYFDSVQPEAAFVPETTLGSLLDSEYSASCNAGMIEALSIQVPEKIGRELAAVAPHAAAFREVRLGFARSVVWRNPASFSEEALEYIDGAIGDWKDSHDRLLDSFLAVAPNPSHPFNAEFLHGHLMNCSMPERDAWWSVYLHEQYGEEGSVDRLIDWASSDQDKAHLSDEALALAATALSWFLTASNRFVRDRATKALVSLLSPRLRIVHHLLERFEDVDDPYVSERLYAVAYGCMMRSSDAAAATDLADYVYRGFFAGGDPTPHVLLRDYARGVIERAVSLGCKLGIDMNLVRPPYRSAWPEDIPTEEELRKRYGRDSTGPYEEGWATGRIFHSVLGFEDFARYVIGINSGSFEWSSRRLGEPSPLTPKETIDRFVKLLTPKQLERWQRYEIARKLEGTYRHIPREKRLEIFPHELADAELEAMVRGAETWFHKSLGAKKRETYETCVVPYIEHPRADAERFDLGLAQRFILQRVFELGWTEERFGAFDRSVNRYTNDYRSAHKAERIGKKYQWLAWHEFLARVSDNFEFRGDRWRDDEQRYEGPWQIGARDIDPSCTLTGTGRNDWGATPRCWWSPVEYDGFAQGPFGLDWVNEHDDLPTVPPLLEMLHPKDGSKWLALHTYSGWEEAYDRDEYDRYALPRRDLWYVANAYIVRKEDADAFWEWATRQDFTGRWMPEAEDSYRIFLGEFPWAPAYLSQVSARGVGAGWLPANSDRIPVDTLIPAERYLAEGGGFDCSLGDGFSLMLPVKWLADAMRLRWGGRDGSFCDATGRCVSFDPSYAETGPQALLVRREEFEDFLERSGCEVVWTVLGEKRLIPGGGAPGCLGWMTVWGAYRQRGGRVEGSLRHRVTISSREGDGD